MSQTLCLVGYLLSGNTQASEIVVSSLESRFEGSIEEAKQALAAKSEGCPKTVKWT